MQRELSQVILYELKDPRLGFITIIKVKPTPDLQFAKVFVSVLGPEDKRKISLDLLNRASGYIHRVLGKRIRMRYVPKLSFHYDDTVEQEQEMSRLFTEIAKTDNTSKPE